MRQADVLLCNVHHRIPPFMVLSSLNLAIVINVEKLCNGIVLPKKMIWLL